MEVFTVILAFLTALFSVDWALLIGAAVASGVGLTIVTQLLKSKYIKVPATKYPRTVSVILSFVVGVSGAVVTGLELSSIVSIVVFTIVAFVVSGIVYDKVYGLVTEERKL